MIDMITLYSGTPGSGKSLHCARTIINWSRLGQPVIGNFPVNLRRYKRARYTYLPNEKITPDFLTRFSREYFGNKRIKEGSILLVIDECQLLFNAREWQKTGRAEWLSFFTLHRHLGYDIILIAQFDRMIDKQIRSLIEYEYIHRKMSNFGWQGYVLSLFFGGKTFIAVKRWYPLHERLGSELFHARKRLYSIYDSYATFDAAEPIAEPAAAPEQPKEAPDTTTSLPAPSEPKKKPWINLPRIKLPTVKKTLREPKQSKKRRRCAAIDGSYVRPWDKRSLVSHNGKFLRPGGRSETGWAIGQQKKA